MYIFTVHVLAVLSYRATLLSVLSHLNLKMSGSRSLMVLLLWQLSIWVQLVVWWLCHLWTSVLIIEEGSHSLHCWHEKHQYPNQIAAWRDLTKFLCQISPLDSDVFLLQQLRNWKQYFYFSLPWLFLLFFQTHYFIWFHKHLSWMPLQVRNMTKRWLLYLLDFMVFMSLESFLTLVNIQRIVPFKFNIFWRFLNKTILYRFQAW